jgi:tetratricopeptide (TPR) repeat protein
LESKNLILIVFILILTLASCKKEANITNKNEALQVLQSVSSLKDNITRKDKILYSLYKKLLKNRNDSINRNILFQIGNIYYYDNNLDKYLTIIRKVNKLATKDNDSTQIAKSLHYIGDYYDEKNQLDSAFSYYYKSEKLYYLIKDTLRYTKLKINKAGILYDNGNFNESEIELIKALKILNKKRSYDLAFTCYNILALNLKELKDYSKSLYYFNLAQLQLNILEKKDTTNIQFSKSTCLNNIGNVYIKMREFNKAARFYQKGLSYEKLKYKNPGLYAMLLSNLAYTKLMQKNMSNVKEMLFKSYKIRDLSLIHI